MSKPMTAADMGRKGGRNRAANLTADERRQIAQQGIRARWDRTQPHIEAVLDWFDAYAIAAQIEMRLATVPAELRDEVRRRALREAVRRMREAVASSSASSSIGLPE